MARRYTEPNIENATLEELRWQFKYSKSQETKRRCMCIIMLLTGSPREQVCKAMDITERTLRNLVFAFNVCGIDGLIVKKRPGAPKKITTLLDKEIADIISQPEVDERTFWTAKAFHGYLQDKYHMECSYRTVVRFFHEKNYSLQVPRPWSDKQDEEQRTIFREKLKDLCQDENIDIWYADETGVDGEPKPRRRWALKGSNPIVVKNGDHIRMSILGTVCPRTGEFFAIEASYSDSEVFQAFLDQASKCIKPIRKRNILILDNASWHKKKSLNWHFFEPIFLPTYSQDMNPIETLWLIMKAQWFNNINCKTVEDLLLRMDKAILDLINNPQKVASATNYYCGKN